MGDAQAREIVAVGASAGGVEALTSLAASLPETLDAAVLVVLHVAATGPSLLPRILDRAGPLPADHVRHHEELEHGRIYVAPPDQHLTVLPNGLAELGRGPRENGYRPSIDRLFRSAADVFGPHVTGVVLSGALDDGSAGLRAISRAGGRTLVQTPETALYPSMPRAALAVVPEAEALDIDGIAEAIAEQTRAVPALVAVQEVGGGMAGGDNGKQVDELERGDNHRGEITGFTCPECSGTLWEVKEGELVRFECRVGHTYSTEGLVGAHAASLEGGLWAAARALEEKAAISNRLALRLDRNGQTRSAKRFREQAEESLRMCSELQALIERLPAPPLADESLAGV
jgi:two-component system chemotaxis response regulator CheB